MADINVAVPAYIAAYLESSRYPNLGDATYGPDKATDGNDADNPRWNSALTNPSDAGDGTGQWLGFDFGANVDIRTVRMKQFISGAYTYASRWKLQTATNSTFTAGLTDVYDTGGSGGPSSPRSLSGTFTARYWRVIAIGDGGSSPNGWGIDSLELWGDPPIVVLDQSLDFPFINDTEQLYAPVFKPDQFLAFSLIPDVEQLFPAGFALDLVIQFPLIADTEQLFAPTFAPDRTLAFPLLDDDEQMFAPSFFHVLEILFPLLTDTDLLLPFSLNGLPADQTLTLPLLADNDAMYPLSLISNIGIVFPFIGDEEMLFDLQIAAGPVVITLPLLDDGDEMISFMFLPDLFPIYVTSYVQYWKDDNPIPARTKLYIGQTIGVVFQFLTKGDTPYVPESAVFTVRSPTGIETILTAGIDDDLWAAQSGQLEARVLLSEPGPWYYKILAVALGGRVQTATEGRFRVTPTKIP